jgi:hypothetical protein
MRSKNLYLYHIKYEMCSESNAQGEIIVIKIILIPPLFRDFFLGLVTSNLDGLFAAVHLPPNSGGIFFNGGSDDPVLARLEACFRIFYPKNCEVLLFPQKILQKFCLRTMKIRQHHPKAGTHSQNLKRAATKKNPLPHVFFAKKPATKIVVPWQKNSPRASPTHSKNLGSLL